MRKLKKCKDITYSEAMEKIENEKPKTRVTTRIYFWLFILFAVLAMFMLWLERGGGGEGEETISPINITIAIAAICLSVFFAMIVFIRFIRRRSITGGLFLTTCISTAVFLGTSQLLPVVIAPAAIAFGAAPGAEEGGMLLIVALSQIGLFAVWFAFLLFTIYLYVKPVKRIDKYLGKIVEGENIRKVKIGHARQYKVIEEKLRFLIDSRTRPESKGTLPQVAEMTNNPSQYHQDHPQTIQSPG